MISLIQSLNSFAGLISVVLLLIVSIVAGRYTVKSNVHNTTNEAQKSAIEAMHAEIDVLRGKIEDIKSESMDIKKENIRLQITIDTIKSALKGMGLVVTVDGEMVMINDGKSSVATRMHTVNGQ